VNITSIAAVMSPPFEAMYAASKHALDGLSASLDLELDGRHDFGPGSVGGDAASCCARPERGPNRSGSWTPRWC
jgi:NADP-dependent 3-hydroxy acid dehydrogenase YdfG